MRRPYLPLALFVAFLLAAPSFAADEKKDQSSGAQADTDKCFIEMAAIGNKFEAQLSQAAAQQASDQQVKDFAQKMADDHKNAEQQYQQVAEKLGVNIPNELPQIKQRKLDAIKSLQGADFDKAYIAHEVAYHQQVLDAIDSTLVPNAKNAELKALIVKVRPAFVGHHEHAKQIQSKLGKAA